LVNDFRGGSHKKANVSYHQIFDKRGFAHRDLSKAPAVHTFHRVFLRTDAEVLKGQELLGCYGREFQQDEKGQFYWDWGDCDANDFCETQVSVCECLCVCQRERERERACMCMITTESSSVIISKPCTCSRNYLS
jgi:hypothetical protein